MCENIDLFVVLSIVKLWCSEVTHGCLRVDVEARHSDAVFAWDEPRISEKEDFGTNFTFLAVYEDVESAGMALLGQL